MLKLLRSVFLPSPSPPPLPLPHPEQFDQSLSAYLGMNDITTEHFKPTNHTNCMLLKRDINFGSYPPPLHQNNDGNSISNNEKHEQEEGGEELLIVRSLINYVDGVRTYLMHVPGCLANHFSSDNQSNISIVQSSAHACSPALLPLPFGHQVPLGSILLISPLPLANLFMIHYFILIFFEKQRYAYMEQTRQLLMGNY